VNDQKLDPRYSREQGIFESDANFKNRIDELNRKADAIKRICSNAGSSSDIPEFARGIIDA